MPQLGDLLARIALGETLGRGEAETLRLEFNNLQNIGAVAKKWAAPNGELDLSFLPIHVLYSKKLAVATASIPIEIPSIINHVLIFGNGRSDDNNNNDLAIARFNDDTGNNYDDEYLDGWDAVVSAAGVSGTSRVFLGKVPAATSPASAAGSHFSILSNCQSQLFKTCLSLEGSRTSAASNYVSIDFGCWRSTERIRKITISLDSTDNFVVGSMFSVVGIV